MRLTEDEYKNLLIKNNKLKNNLLKNNRIIEEEKRNKNSKYKNKRIKIDSYTFDSIKESKYYIELKLRLQSNDIVGFCLQPKFILTENITYIPDFIVFENDGITRIIDIKGFETDVFKLKKKLFESKYPNLKLEIIK